MILRDRRIPMPKNISPVSIAAASFCALASLPGLAADNDYLQQEAQRDWSGFYAGVALGSATGGSDFENIGKKDELDIDDSGYAASAIAGYNFTSNGWMLGVETDLTRLNIDNTSAAAGLGSITQEADWLGSLALRGGYAWDSVMVYGTAGLAASDYEVSSSLGGKSDKLKAALLLGIGAEYAIQKDWTARAELLGYGFGGKASFGGSNRDFASVFGVARVGLTHKF
jgi:outer membrane immunogenic protein